MLEGKLTEDVFSRLMKKTYNLKKKAGQEEDGTKEESVDEIMLEDDEYGMENEEPIQLRYGAPVHEFLYDLNKQQAKKLELIRKKNEIDRT